MRKLVTIAAPKKGGNDKQLKQFSADQLKLMVELLKKLGVKCMVNSKTVSASLNGVFWLGATRTGGLMLVGGEDGFTGDEEFGYEITEQLEQYAGLQVNKSVEKAFKVLAKDIAEEIEESPVEHNSKSGSSNEDIILKAKMLPANFTGTFKGTPCLFVIDGTKKGLDEKAMVMASEGRALIGKNIPLDKISDVEVINPKTQWEIFHDTVMLMARDTK